MIKLLRFDWILKIQIFNPFFLIVLFQPIYVIWMFKIGRLGEKRLNQKPNMIFLFSCIIFFLSMITAVCFVTEITKNTVIDRILESKGDQLEEVFVVITILSWLFCSFYASMMTFKIEESLNEDYIPTLQDKVIRFFQILYWIFGIWVIQPKINELEKKIK